MLKFIPTDTYVSPVEVDAQGMQGKFRVRFNRVDAIDFARLIDDIREKSADDEPGALERLVAFRTEKLNQYVAEILDVVDDRGNAIPSDQIKDAFINNTAFAVAILDAFMASNQNAKSGNSSLSRKR